MKTKKILIGCLVFTAASVASTQAAVLASEDFNSYADGTSIATVTGGGTGWGANWTSLGTSHVVDSAGVANGWNHSFRALGTTAENAFSAGSTVWLSLDYNNGNGANAYGGLSFFDGGISGDERVIIGNTSEANSNWGLGAGLNQDSSAISAQGMQTGVARLTIGAGATSTIELWVGAIGGGVDVSGTAIATITGVTLAGVDGIRINEGAAGYQYDNIILGNTFADVGAIPEPSTYALLAGLTGLAFVMVRRRR